MVSVFARLAAYRKVRRCVERFGYSSRLTDGGFVYDEVGIVSIKSDVGSDGQSGVQRDVAEGKVHYHGNFERQKTFFQNVDKCLTVFFECFGFWIFTVVIDADGNSGDLLEDTGGKEVGQHAIETVGGFVEIFEEENGAFERREIRRAHEPA